MLARARERGLDERRIDACLAPTASRAVARSPASSEKGGARAGRTRESASSPPAHRREHVEQRIGAAAARRAAPSDRAGPSARYRVKDGGRDDPAVEQAPQGPARARRSPSCANTSATCSSSRATAAADAQRAIERFVDQARHLGVVGHREAGIEIGFERELAQQRQAERVDRADGDVADAIAQLAPARRRNLAARRPPRAALARMRSRISAAALRVNVIARMFAGSTPARSRLT